MNTHFIARRAFVGVAALIGAAVVGSSPAFADLYSRDPIEARYDLDRSESDVASASRVADQAQANFHDADARARETADAARKLESRLDELNDRIDQNEKALSALPEGEAQKPQDLLSLQEDAHDARDEYRRSRDAARKAEDLAYQSLESTDAYRAAADRADQAAGIAAQAEKRIIDALSANDPRYRRVVDDFEAARSRVELLSRPPVDDADLSDARKELDAAQREVDSIEEPALAADPQVVESRKAADRAGATVKSMRAAFDRDEMPRFREVTDARKALASARKDYDTALASLREGEDHTADAQDRRARLLDSLAADRRELKDVKAEFDEVRSDAKAATQDALAARREVDRSLNDVNWVQQNRDDALYEVQRSQDIEDTFCRWGSTDFVFSWGVFSSRYYVPQRYYVEREIVYRDGYFCPPCRPLIVIVPRHSPYRSVWVSDFRGGGDGWRRPPREFVERSGRDDRHREALQSDAVRRAAAENERQQRLAAIDSKRLQLAQAKVALNDRQVQYEQDRSARETAEKQRREQDRSKLAVADEQRMTSRTQIRQPEAADRAGDKYYERQRATGVDPSTPRSGAAPSRQRDESHQASSVAAQQREQAVRKANEDADIAKAQAHQKALEDRSNRRLTSQQDSAESRRERAADATPDRQADAPRTAEAPRADRSASERRESSRDADKSDTSAARKKNTTVAPDQSDRDAAQPRQAAKDDVRDRSASDTPVRQQRDTQRQSQQQQRQAQRDAADRAAGQRDAARSADRDAQRATDHPSRQPQGESRGGSDSSRSTRSTDDTHLGQNSPNDSDSGRRGR